MKNFYLKKLIRYLIPLLIPIIVLGSLSSIITHKYVKNNIQKNNEIMLKQLKQNIELIVNDLEPMIINFDAHPQISVRLQNLFNNTSLGIDEISTLNTIKNIIIAPVSTSPYIHSIYVYYYNENQNFLSSDSGIVNLSTYYDSHWYEQFSSQEDNIDFWTESRTLNQYSFDNPKNITTIYKKLIKGNGVLILNLNTDSVESVINESISYDLQHILVVDENNHPIFRSDNDDFTLSSDDITKVFNNTHIIISGEKYTISHLISEQYGWKYISLVSDKELYKVPNILNLITLVALLVSIVVGSIITSIVIKRDINRINGIVDIIKSAEQGLDIPDTPSNISDEYGYIMHNIIKTFIERKYLKLQLSERKYRLQTLELLALQSQINPHFLYNTLETVNWKALSLKGKRTAVNDIIENLSDILKYSLSSPRETVTFKEEIDNTSNYIDIQKVRNRGKFDVIWQYDDSILSNKIIKLILQPIIENSIYHGIKEKDGTSLIKIRIKAHEDLIRFDIIDNGLGIPKDKLAEINQQLKSNSINDKYSHIGLLNTSKRLQLMFGTQYYISVRSKYHFGTVVSFSVPKQK